MIKEIDVLLWEVSKDEILNNKKLKFRQILVYEPSVKKFMLFLNSNKEVARYFFEDIDETAKFFTFEEP